MLSGDSDQGISVSRQGARGQPARGDDAKIIRPHGSMENVDPKETSRIVAGIVAYKMRWTPHNGDCLFQAVVQGLSGPDNGQPIYTHQDIRRHAVEYMTRHSVDYVGYMDGGLVALQEANLKDYLFEMGDVGTWGDTLVLDALCKVHNTNVAVLEEERGHTYTWRQFGPSEGAQKSFWLYRSGEFFENLLDFAQLGHVVMNLAD